MNFSPIYQEQDKQKVEKQDETESEPQNNENDYSDTGQKQNQDRLTSINKIQSYFKFMNILSVAKKQGQSNDLINSLENVLQQLQDRMNQQRKNGQNQEITLLKNQQKSLSNLQMKFALQIQKRIFQTRKFKKSLKFTKQLIIHEILPSKSYQILKIQVQLLWYETEICILNELGNNPFYNSLRAAGSGSFGNVYFTKIIEDYLAVKCLPLKKLTDDSERIYFEVEKLTENFRILKKALTQYFFVILFSELRIGPQSKTIGGFDMIIYQDSIAFATEICLPSRFNQEINDLSQSLLCMHMLQIVHRDIKPSNFMYSETYKKNVFIDFGCTEVLDSKIGEKLVTRFAGTPIFCSDEVLLLLKEKKKFVDLYFNDIHGFKKSMLEITTSYILIQKPTLKISQIDKAEFISLKHSLYAQNYSKFNSLWKKIRRMYPQNFQQMQRKLLQFFKDLKPNETLRKFYWEELHSDLKDQPEFKDLEVVMKNDHSKLLFYLDINRSKTDSFKMRKILFKKLQIELSDFTSHQKEIDLCLIHRTIIEKKISVLVSKINTYNFAKKEIWFNIREDFEKLCIVVCNYSSICQNSFEIKNEQKIAMCMKVLKIVEKMQDPSLNEIQIVFKSPIQIFEPMSQFYQYFLFKIFPKISQKQRQRTIIHSISTLFLLGYPLHMYSKALVYLEYRLISLTTTLDQLHAIVDEERIQKINMFWEVKNLIFVFSSHFYQQNSARSLNGVTHKRLKDYKSFEQRLMRPKNNETIEFFDLNYSIYKEIVRNKSQINNHTLQKCIRILNSPKISEIESQNKKIKKWKQLVSFFLFCCSNFYQLNNTNLILNFLEKVDFFGCQHNHLISPFLLYYKDQIIKNRVGNNHLIKIIDERINDKDLSLRFLLEERCDVALEKRDLQQLQQIFSIIKKQFKTLFTTSKNLEFIQNILNIFCNFLNLHFLILPNLTQEVLNLLYIFFPIFILGIQMVMTLMEQEETKLMMQSLIKLQNENLSISLLKIGQELPKRKRLKVLVLKLIQLRRIYKKISILTEAYKSQFGLGHNMTKIIDKIDGYKIILPEKYVVFLDKLQNQRIIFDYTSYLLKLVFSNKGLRQQIKTNLNLAIQMSNLWMSDSKNREEIIMRHQIIKDIFDEISSENFLSNSTQSILIPFRIIFDYILFELRQTKCDPYWCDQMIMLYKVSWEKDNMKEIFIHQGYVRFLFDCLVYKNQSFKEIKLFLSRYCLALKLFPTNFLILSFKETLVDLFWCYCKRCFPRTPQKWNHDQFTEYLASTLKEQTEIQNPYMSLVYVGSLYHKQLTQTTYRRFFMSILRAMPYLIRQARQFIMSRIYYIAYVAIYKDKSEKNTLMQCFPSFASSSTYGDQNLKYQAKNKKITKTELKTQHHSKLFYYYKMFLKNQYHKIEQLNVLIEKRFFKEKFIKNYVYPPLVRNVYFKKMNRYHEIKENYKKKDKSTQILEVHPPIHDKL